jgi:hypothetical protein
MPAVAIRNHRGIIRRLQKCPSLALPTYSPTVPRASAPRFRSVTMSGLHGVAYKKMSPAVGQFDADPGPLCRLDIRIGLVASGRFTTQPSKS